MKITCISASNIEMAREKSASTKACHLIRDLIMTKNIEANVEIIQLIDYEFVPCRMCGNCYKLGSCVRDDAFNQILRQLISSDAIFVVCPHYVLIPAKLTMVLEKLQEMAYLLYCADSTSCFILHEKPIGVIVHGGQTNDALEYYKTNLLNPLANAFASIQMHVVDAGPEWMQGVAFGIKRIIQPKDSIFITIEHDWDEIEQLISPLVNNVLSYVNQQ